RVRVKGMDFDGHRRTARVRACLKSVQRPTLGEICGETCTDIGVIGLCDIVTFEKHVRAKHLDRYGEDLEAVLHDGEGGGGIQFDYGRAKKGVGLMLTRPR